LIHGNAELLVDPQEVLDRAVRPFFTNAEERLLDGIGHTPFYEAEKEVAGFILGFVSRISPTPEYSSSMGLNTRRSTRQRRWRVSSLDSSLASHRRDTTDAL